ncbi:protein serine/threonine kinase, putative [Entamoeba invadens IP1]|uniref:Protein serine/threonine kinase, putative n=1 Tax=Entamoeba invadens IP1 TaxID=370355 RepID=A0A0A1UFU3_ENTIV|nr:protein serine/threonine kinase, putative [Entamoeba invadens IP1]ELP91924.1 protein serine/threonine kinase, putative [Entamoeba invadens IP1]|eukprot:XP_004258695.1 protein serine/threonine kinase, putative [Entamoeba invadens IP1]
MALCLLIVTLYVVMSSSELCSVPSSFFCTNEDLKGIDSSCSSLIIDQPDSVFLYNTNCYTHLFLTDYIIDVRINAILSIDPPSNPSDPNAYFPFSRSGGLIVRENVYLDIYGYINVNRYKTLQILNNATLNIANNFTLSRESYEVNKYNIVVDIMTIVESTLTLKNSQSSINTLSVLISSDLILENSDLSPDSISFGKGTNFYLKGNSVLTPTYFNADTRTKPYPCLYLLNSSRINGSSFLFGDIVYSSSAISNLVKDDTQLVNGGFVGTFNLTVEHKDPLFTSNGASLFLALDAIDSITPCFDWISSSTTISLDSIYSLKDSFILPTPRLLRYCKDINKLDTTVFCELNGTQYIDSTESIILYIDYPFTFKHCPCFGELCTIHFDNTDQFYSINNQHIDAVIVADNGVKLDFTQSYTTPFIVSGDISGVSLFGGLKMQFSGDGLNVKVVGNNASTIHKMTINDGNNMFTLTIDISDLSYFTGGVYTIENTNIDNMTLNEGTIIISQMTMNMTSTVSGLITINLNIPLVINGDKCYSFTIDSNNTFSCLKKCGTCETNNNNNVCTPLSGSTGCLVCSSTSVCLICADGYYLYNGACVPCTTKFCDRCSRVNGKCLSCMDGYSLVSSTCVDCTTPLYCHTCSAKGICVQCQEPYTLYSSKECRKCEGNVEGCDVCSTMLYGCSVCQDTYFLRNSNCTKCTEIFCEDCDKVTGQCRTCMSGYFLNDYKQCELCTTKDHCFTCSLTSNQCNVCDKDYYPNGKGCSSCASQNCNVCDSTTGRCSLCTSNYYIQSGKCVPCSEKHCASCTQDGYCVGSCDYGYTMTLDNQCVLCRNITGCSKCSQTEYQCNECLSGYFMKDNICVSCEEKLGCFVCSTTSDNCDTCQGGFTPNGTECIDCRQNTLGCKTCSVSSYKCTDCYDGYFTTSTINNCEPCKTIHCYGTSATCSKDGKCSQCEDGYLLDTTQTCLPCSTITGCLKCSPTQKECYICEDGKYLDNKLCYNCSTKGCNTCSATGGCYDCLEGNYLSGELCLSCVLKPECATCSRTSDKCDVCKQGYFPYLSGCISCASKHCTECDSQSGICTTCISGYYIDKTGNCQVCSKALSNCGECTSTSVCTSCFDEFYLKENECHKCSEKSHCMVCSKNSDTCTTCFDRYYPNITGCALCETKNCKECDSTTGECSACVNGYYLDNKMCSKCNTNCAKCDSQSSCIVCDSNYSNINGTCTPCSNKANCVTCDPQTDKCFECGLGMYPSDGNCVTCTSQNCSECNSINGWCNSCLKGSYMSEGKCLSCSNKMPGCLSCSASDICYECINELYYLENAICVDCSTKANCMKCYSDRDGCQQCAETFYPAGKVCETCLSKHCTSCDSRSGICTSCTEGYTLKNGSCVACESSHCLNCDQQNKPCDICEPNYSPNSEYYCVACDKENNMHCAQNLCSQSEYQVCQECTLGYYLVDTLCNNCSKDKGCYLCDKTNGDCYICDYGYYKHSKTCLKCGADNVLHCKENRCSLYEEDKCNDCALGYFMNNGECVSCTTNACKLCDGVTGVCTSCNDDEYLEDHICKKCDDSNPMHCLPNNCSPNSTECLSCNSGYYLSNGECRVCTLTNPNSCIPGRCKGDAASGCLDCKEGYVKNEKEQCESAALIMENCELAATYNFCVKCRDGYVQEQGQCISLSCDDTIQTQDTVCSSHCEDVVSLTSTCGIIENCEKGKVSTDGDICLVCEDNKSVSEGVCIVDETEGCLYSRNGQCYNSEIGYYNGLHGVEQCVGSLVCIYNTDTMGTEIFECDEGKVLTDFLGLKVCSDQDDYCAVYSRGTKGVTTCRTCKSGYFLHSGMCSACDNFALQCDSFGVLTCPEGTIRYNEICINSIFENCRTVGINMKCVVCEDGYYLDISGTCSAVTNGCKYQTIDGCLECYGKMYQNNQCDTTTKLDASIQINQSNILKALKEEDNSRIVSIENCVREGGSGCMRCERGTYLSGAACVKCPSMCETCSNETVCFSCNEGYYKSEGECIKIGEDNSCKHFLTSGDGCYECKPHYYREGISCKDCDTSCETCSTYKSCNTCIADYFKSDHMDFCVPLDTLTNCVNKTSRGCIQCDTGYYLFFSECNKCTENCDSCKGSGATECVTCSPGYIRSTFNSEFGCISYTTVSQCEGAFNSTCTGCAGYYSLSKDRMSCEQKSVELATIPIVFGVAVIVILLVAVVVTLIIVFRFKQREKEANVGKVIFKMRYSDIQFTNSIATIVCDRDVLNYDEENIPVGKENEETFYIGNISEHTIKVQFTTKESLPSSKYYLRTEPSMVTLHKGMACEFKLYLTPACTCKINDDIIFSVLDLHKGKVSEGALRVSVETDWSTMIDYDELKEEKKIGEGSFGVVYRGIYRTNTVAIKKMIQRPGDDSLDEFKLEVSMLDKFRSPYIVHFYGAVVIPNKICMVTEFAQYGSLQSLKDVNTKASEAYSIRYKLLLDASKGIEYLHNNEVLHRDIKPDNILVFSLVPNEKTNAKLTDFGSSRNINAFTQNKTFTKGIGTPIYMAPEVLQGIKYGYGADVYSFAITMFEIDVWGEAFPSEEFAFPWMIADFVFKGNRPPYREGMSKILYSVIEKAWCMNLEERSSMGDIVKSLEEIVATKINTTEQFVINGDEIKTILSDSPRPGIDSPKQTQEKVPKKNRVVRKDLLI